MTENFVQLKNFIENCYKLAVNSKSAKTVDNLQFAAYGAAQFAINAGMIPYDEVEAYWDEMHEKFFDLWMEYNKEGML